jgi:hypothetical protein
MTTFDEREHALEAKFAHDGELRFKVLSRRNKMVGEWAAQKLGLHGAAVADYVQAVIKAGLPDASGERVKAKVAADLAAKGIPVADAELTKLMGALLVRAAGEVENTSD